MNKRTLIIGVIVLAAIAVAAGLFFTKTSLTSLLPLAGGQVVSKSEPVDVVLDFYQPWLTALKTAGTDPYKAGLAQAPILSPELRTRLAASAGHAATVPDPVLCQTTPPAQISARLVSKVKDQAQVLVVSTDKKQTAQAVITLTQLNGGWYINDIKCSLGEFGPQREFSFDTEGYLIKSVKPPLDPKHWYLVFVEDGVPGHTAPLIFGTASMCTDVGGTKAVCNPTKFIEPSKAHVQGQMTETGVKVQNLQLMP
jgi:hypothetical protein